MKESHATWMIKASAVVLQIFSGSPHALLRVKLQFIVACRNVRSDH